MGLSYGKDTGILFEGSPGDSTCSQDKNHWTNFVGPQFLEIKTARLKFMLLIVRKGKINRGCSMI